MVDETSRATAAAELLRTAERMLVERRVDDALAYFYEAERSDCDADRCASGRWECHMLKGHFERAWRESDSIAERGKLDPNRFWNGDTLAGKRVLIRCLHGLGDTIQFIRYAPQLRNIARSVVIEAQPDLKVLLAGSGLADHVMTWREREPEWDAQIEIIELPRIFRTTIDTIPQHVPYLRAGTARLPIAHDGIRRPRVGVVWSASNYNRARSVPPELIGKLFQTRGADIFSLQAGTERFAVEAHHLYQEHHSLLDTASLVQSLDLVITVDTMMAHLAGALAVPVWTLLPYQSDWRWMLARADSPWYPTMRLFRQRSAGNWDEVIERVSEDLGLLTESLRREG
jgi:hypothetical protein